MTKDIHDLASEMNRLSPSQVDDTISGNGQHEAGHRGHEARCMHDRGGCTDECHMATVGWFCDGGASGQPVLRIHTDDIAAAVDRLAALPDGEIDTNGIRSVDAAMAGLRFYWT